MLTANKVIKLLNLQPLPVEGGMFRCTYVSDSTNAGKPAGTAVYYMLTENSFSHMHRLPTDEIYHFYIGESVEILELLPDGSFRTTILGSNILAGEKPQYVIPAGVWQGLRVVSGGSFALLGTTMAPGYVDSDYEHGDKSELCAKYPEAKELIEKRIGEAVAY